MARVLLGVTGGIAAYKACELIRLLVRDGEEVVPVPTAGAERFVRRTTFEALARRRVPDDIYPHLGEADLLAIAPLSANTMARLAAGLADNPVAEVALAFAGPVLVAPAMNSRMWEHPATQANAATLRARGIEMIGPAEGSLAEGEVGIGRMAEPGEIHLRVRALLASGSDRSLAGRSLTVTAGGTREALDTVRFIGNRSSGRMGVALARAAQRRGAHVTLVGANLSVVPPPGVRVVTVRSAAELARATSEHAAADVVIMAAAVSDYRPRGVIDRKRKKDGTRWTIELEETDDILAGLGQKRRPDQILVGFAADEGEDGLEAARAKRIEKGANLIVFNDVSLDDVGFESDHNAVVIIGHAGEEHVGRTTKDACAEAILDRVSALLEES